MRELRNAMERAAVLVRGDRVDAAHLGFLDEATAASNQTVDWPDEDPPTAIARLEEMLIRRALGRSGGNRAETARMLNIHRQLLYAKMKRYGLTLSDERTESVVNPDGVERDDPQEP
jgi:two-component system NtrC family response regulator